MPKIINVHTRIETEWENFDPFAGGLASISQGFGIPTSINVRKRRQGSNLLIEGSFVCGTTTAVEARMAFDDILVGDSSIIGTEIAGSFGYTDPVNPSIYPLREGGVSYISFASQGGTGGALSKNTASSRFSSGDRLSFVATIQIQGWENN